MAASDISSSDLRVFAVSFVPALYRPRKTRRAATAARTTLNPPMTRRRLIVFGSSTKVIADAERIGCPREGAAGDRGWGHPPLHLNDATGVVIKPVFLRRRNFYG